MPYERIHQLHLLNSCCDLHFKQLHLFYWYLLHTNITLVGTENAKVSHNRLFRLLFSSTEAGKKRAKTDPTGFKRGILWGAAFLEIVFNLLE